MGFCKDIKKDTFRDTESNGKYYGNRDSIRLYRLRACHIIRIVGFRVYGP